MGMLPGKSHDVERFCRQCLGQFKTNFFNLLVTYAYIVDVVANRLSLSLQFGELTFIQPSHQGQ